MHWESRRPPQPKALPGHERDIIRCSWCDRSAARFCMASLVLTRSANDGSEVTRDEHLCPDCREAFEILTRHSSLDRLAALFGART